MKKIAFILTIVVLFGCGGSTSDSLAYAEETSTNTMGGSEYKDEVSSEYYEEEPVVSQQNREITKQNAKKDIRKLIREAHLTMQVEDIDKGRAELNAIVKKYNGYYSNETTSKNDYRVTSTYVIRVPEANFDSIVSSSGRIAKNIDSKEINVKDVTEDYYDTESRLKTKRRVEQRYVEILDKARTIKEILEVEDKLRVIREEIEAKEGHLRLLKDLVGYSTVNITIYQAFDYEYRREDRPGFGQKLLSALDSGWSGLLNFTIGLFYLWPFWIILFVVIWFLRKYLKKRKAQKL